MMYEHLAGAAVVALIGSVCAIALMRSQSVDFKRAGRLILATLLLQIGLGVGAWVTKLSVPALGWVAQTGSPSSVIFRSLHTVGGMFLLAAATIASVQIVRAMNWQAVPDRITELPGAKGGLA